MQMILLNLNLITPFTIISIASQCIPSKGTNRLEVAAWAEEVRVRLFHVARSDTALGSSNKSEKSTLINDV